MTSDKISGILETLNEEQKKCVENLDGKFLVLAGPGTGKTHTVIKRLQVMILQGVKPERILCMTYSRAAADEMKKRVLEQIDENNNNVEIHTFHSFCNKLLMQHYDDFDLSPKISVIPHSIKIDYIKKCIDGLNDDYCKGNGSNKYTKIEFISEAISYFKRFKITDIDDTIANDAEWEPRNNQQKLAKVQKVKSYFNLYKKYQEMMRDNNYIDFDDMINLIVDKFKKYPEFAKEVSDEYDYIIIDEYQDTNKAQNELIFCLTDNSEKGNLFVVGDDKQIINSSQGARIDSIRCLMEKYGDEIGEPIKFTQNHRSTDVILKAAKTVADLNTLLLDNDIELVSVNNDKLIKKYGNNKVRLAVYSDEETQAAAIVKEISELINSNKCPVDEKTKEKDYSQIAIFSTKDAELEYYANLLHDKGIPYELKNGKNAFEIKSSIILYNYLQALVNPDEYSDKIFRLLLLPPYNISADSFSLLYNEKSKHPHFISAMKAICAKADAPDDIKNFIETYNSCKTAQKGETLYHMVTRCVAETGILDSFLKCETNKLENVLGIKCIIDEAYNFSKEFNNVNLEDFISHLELLEENNEPLNIQKEKINAVQLVTYQSAKGLEFEYVYMPTLQASRWEGNKTKPAIKPSIPLPQDEQRTKQVWDSYTLADRINKMYVGMTRAIHTLRMSYVSADGAEGVLSKLINTKILEPYIEPITLPKDSKNSENLYKWAEAFTSKNYHHYDYAKEFESDIDAKLAKLLKSYSPTKITPYIQCPRKFLFSSILELNSPNLAIPDALNFGLAVHDSFKAAIDYAAAEENKKFWDKDVYITEAIKQLNLQPFSSYQKRQDYEEKIKTKIADFYENVLSKFEINDIYLYEKAIEADYEGIHFKGLPDLIIKSNKGLIIYDYKTGNPPNSDDVICLTDEKDEKIGYHEDYYIQMGMYKYFVQKTNKNKLDVVETTFLFPLDYTSPYTVNYSDDDIKKIFEKFKKAVKGLQAKEFEPTPSLNSCKFCPYQNNLCELKKVEQKK